MKNNPLPKLGVRSYSATVSVTRPATDYNTARVIPRYDGVAVPLEAAQILCSLGN